MRRGDLVAEATGGKDVYSDSVAILRQVGLL
jgi:hypothetical protein